MTQEQETALHDFEARVRQLMMAYKEACRENAELKRELDAANQRTAEAEAALAESKRDYDVLKTARMIEVSGDDVKASRARIAKLIREVDKCIALLDV